MFELAISKAHVLTPLLTVTGAVDKKQAMPVLSNVLLTLMQDQLLLTATDLEIEITARVPCTSQQQEGSITVPAKKMVDIIRSLEDDAFPTISFKDNTVVIKEGRSQFKLATLPAEHYPCTEFEENEFELSLPRAHLIHLLQSTHFAMSQQDVRVFLNGLLLELDMHGMTSVGTDGHRMAICRLPYPLEKQQHLRLLIPRKGILEMLRLLSNLTEDNVLLAVGKNHIKVIAPQYTFSSKLIEARFPPYMNAIPKHQTKQVTLDRDVLKRALSRIIILAHEKSRAIVLHLQENQLTLISHNQEQDEAIETLEARTEGDELKIGINATYLLDVLQHMSEGLLTLSFSTTDGSILVTSVLDENYQYIIMPMTL